MFTYTPISFTELVIEVSGYYWYIQAYICFWNIIQFDVWLTFLAKRLFFFPRRCSYLSALLILYIWTWTSVLVTTSEKDQTNEKIISDIPRKHTALNFSWRMKPIIYRYVNNVIEVKIALWMSTHMQLLASFGGQKVAALEVRTSNPENFLLHKRYWSLKCSFVIALNQVACSQDSDYNAEMWQSRVHCIMIPLLKWCCAKLLWRAGLICAAKMHDTW